MKKRHALLSLPLHFLSLRTAREVARQSGREGDAEKARDAEQCSLDGCILCVGPAPPIIGRHSIAAH